MGLIDVWGAVCPRNLCVFGRRLITNEVLFAEPHMNPLQILHETKSPLESVTHNLYQILKGQNQG